MNIFDLFDSSEKCFINGKDQTVYIYSLQVSELNVSESKINQILIQAFKNVPCNSERIEQVPGKLTYFSDEYGNRTYYLRFIVKPIFT